MTTLLAYKAGAALLILLISLITVLYPLRKKAAEHHNESQELGEALASGIFLGAAFFHMLPDALHGFANLYPTQHYPIAELITVGGFLFLLLLERLALSQKQESTSFFAVPYLLALILIVHALTEGMALGIGTSLAETLLLLIAIAAHKGSESFALCIALLKHELPFSRVLRIVLFFACMTPLGILLGAMLQNYTYAATGQLAAASFNAFAAGTFLYVSTLHHVHFHQHERDTRGLVEYACLLLGTAIMGVTALWG